MELADSRTGRGPSDEGGDSLWRWWGTVAGFEQAQARLYIKLVFGVAAVDWGDVVGPSRVPPTAAESGHEEEAPSPPFEITEVFIR